jgi:AAA+ ATPase superfamily predicted ATPase
MKWSPETRRKLAKMIRDRALGIQEQEFKEAKRTLKTFSEVIKTADSKVLGLLAPLGFKRANKDWEIESNQDIMIFKPSETHLWFTTIQGRVVKISKEKAEKVLVLGMLE